MPILISSTKAEAFRVKCFQFFLAWSCMVCVGNTLFVKNPCCFQIPHTIVKFGSGQIDSKNVEGLLRKVDNLCSFTASAPNQLYLNDTIAYITGGGCDLRIQAWNAQEAGAIGAVISESAFNDIRKKNVDTLIKSSIDIPTIVLQPSDSQKMDQIFLQGSQYDGKVWVDFNGISDVRFLVSDTFFAALDTVKITLVMLSVCSFVGMTFLAYYINNWLRIAKRPRIIRELPILVYSKSLEHTKEANDNTESLEHIHLATSYTDDTAKNELVSASLNDDNIGKSNELDETKGQVDGSLLSDQPEDFVAKIDTIENYFHSDTCPVCLCFFETGDKIMILPCGHSYHPRCIEPWLLNRSAACPICKASILPSGDRRALFEVEMLT